MHINQHKIGENYYSIQKLVQIDCQLQILVKRSKNNFKQVHGRLCKTENWNRYVSFSFRHLIVEKRPILCCVYITSVNSTIYNLCYIKKLNYALRQFMVLSPLLISLLFTSMQLSTMSFVSKYFTLNDHHSVYIMNLNLEIRENNDKFITCQ